MIAAISWWLAIQLCGLLALPLGWRLFARLPGRGYPFAKALGLLLAAYVLWLGASFHLLANDLGGVVIALLALAGVSYWLGGAGLRRLPDTGERPLLAWLRTHLRLVLTTEILFLVAYVVWTFFRAHSGDIAATEKPMEFAFINGVLNSRFFPPQDPWLSGYAISYYYFGYVMLGFLIRLTGVQPAVAFNLAVALWYALVLIGAFGVVYELVSLAQGRVDEGAGEDRGSSSSPHLLSEASPWDRSSTPALRWALVAAFFAGVMGNLEGLVEAAYNARLAPLAWIKWLDINDLLSNPPTGTWSGAGWWWWHASRVINDRDLLGAHIEVIDEFPFFSFLLGDLHPHVLALPFVLLAVVLALNLLLAARAFGARFAGAQATIAHDLAAESRRAARAPSPQALGVRADWTATLGDPRARLRSLGTLWSALAEATGMGLPGIALYALALGALAFLNTWDFPIYLALAALAFGAGLAMVRGLTWETAGQTIGVGLLLGVLGYLAYLPFYLGFQSQAGGLLPNLLFPTRLSQFFLMFGPFLVIIVFFLILLSRRESAPGATTPGPDGSLAQAATTELLDDVAPPKQGLGSRFLAVLPWPLLGPLALVGALLLAAVALPQGRALVDDLLANPAVSSRLPDASIGSLLGLIGRVRLATPWTYLVLALLISWAIALLWRSLSSSPSHFNAEPEDTLPVLLPWRAAGAPRREGGVRGEVGRDVSDIFALILIVLALLLTFSVEFVYLRDFFGSRMNTVFKFYYQAWVLLALASAYGLSRLAQRTTPVRLAAPVLLLAVLLGGAGLVYPLLATPSKAGDFRGPATLDGLAYLRQYDPGDAAAVDWIRTHVPPTSLVLEAPGGSYSTEGAERISMATGNPTLLGWDFHERQWRGKAFDSLTAGRVDAVDRIYRSGRPEELPALLDRWHVDYVYIGDLERRKYGISDAALARFDRAGLQLVYDAGGVRIYAR